ncbi:long-chain acyl-CoA synthetase [Sinobacterium caligoides]|uniref:Long-chain-fatty-acid--CoA ligase n=1 Tax=Sinobacterium caligoides TaxID=933926 RepID=A0A3N2DZS9_9GAMM|nr:AMP-binding protein [Sinobacterium caligoides]ROS04815.1 long-chain acyl-CoA synthetase [Sinobacterium caligoides]
MSTDVKTKEHMAIAEPIDMSEYANLVDVFATACTRFAGNDAFTCLGHTINFAELYEKAGHFTSYLQNHTDLQPGDRVAMMLPNLLQYPAVVFGALQAGMVVVNTNPLYSHREMVHQFNDAEVKAVVVLANMAAEIEAILPETGIKQVVVTQLADFHPPIKRTVINFAAKYIKKMVPPYALPGHIMLLDAMKLGAVKAPVICQPQPDDIAMLQYTGGTTGVAKGAVLLHSNLVANALQCTEMFKGYGITEGAETLVLPLPLYHIYAFTVSLLISHTGNHTILIPNPRDLPSVVKAMNAQKFTMFSGLNTLFVALCNDESFKALDFTNLKATISGGMALTGDAAKSWHEVTGCEVYEGYGLTETAPVLTVNCGGPGGNQVGTIGVPVPGTALKVVDEKGNTLPRGEAGELCAKGPQVMRGYWHRPEATAEVFDVDGFFTTGDIAVIQDDGYLRIVDRKKDMIIVSGFNVFPNEVEEVLVRHPSVLECAVVGVKDDKSGEAPKAFVVVNDSAVDAAELKTFCKESLAAYKVPRFFEFRDELPKSNVGKVLRKDLRE